MAHDAFISYSSKDKTIADAVCARLEARGIRCWIAPRDVQPGQPYGSEIIDAIHDCRVMVLVLSANANASPHIPKEVERAVSNGVPVIPLRVENVMPAKSLDYFISSVHWLDAITPPLESHLESLAQTIRTLLPESAQKIPPPVPQPAPPPVMQPGPATQIPPAPAKPKWLIPVIAVAAVALAVAAWFFFGRTPDSGAPAAVVSPQPAVSEPVAQPTQPANGNPAHHASHPAAIPPAFNAPPPVSASPDPIVGCWHWINNGTVIIRGDGTMTGGPFNAQWRRASANVYNFHWPEAVDSIRLSPDGNSLSGGNQYGVPMTAARLSPGPGIVGAWRWYNGVTVNIAADGNFSALTFAGHWQNTGPGAYSLTWPGPLDTVTLSPDQSRVNGSNQYGFPISGTKINCGG